MNRKESLRRIRLPIRKHKRPLPTTRHRCTVQRPPDFSPRLCFACGEEDHVVAGCPTSLRLSAYRASPEPRVDPRQVAFRVRFDVQRKVEPEATDLGQAFRRLTLGDDTRLRMVCAHFHPDLMWCKGVRAGDWPEQRSREFRFGGGIAVFCYPSLYLRDTTPEQPTTMMLKRLSLKDLAENPELLPPNAILGAAFGVHPKCSDEWNDDVARGLRRILERRQIGQIRALAIGETGLDQTTTIPQAVQLKAFRAQIALAAELSLPIVLHIRPSKRHDESLSLKALQELKQRLQPDHAVHYHSYTHSLELALRWLDAFPHIRFGLTPAVASPTCSTELKAFARWFPLRHLVAESDAPHYDRAKRGTPLNIIKVLKRLAELRRSSGVTLSDVIDQTTRNIEHLYRFRLQ